MTRTRKLAAAFDRRHPPVKPVTVPDVPSLIPRPASSALAREIIDHINSNRRHWQETA